jgi:hypothetical protein
MGQIIVDLYQCSNKKRRFGTWQVRSWRKIDPFALVVRSNGFDLLSPKREETISLHLPWYGNVLRASKHDGQIYLFKPARTQESDCKSIPRIGSNQSKHVGTRLENAIATCCWCRLKEQYTSAIPEASQKSAVFSVKDFALCTVRSKLHSLLIRKIQCLSLAGNEIWSETIKVASLTVFRRQAFTTRSDGNVSVRFANLTSVFPKKPYSGARSNQLLLSSHNLDSG